VGRTGPRRNLTAQARAKAIDPAQRIGPAQQIDLAQQIDPAQQIAPAQQIGQAPRIGRRSFPPNQVRESQVVREPNQVSDQVRAMSGTFSESLLGQPAVPHSAAQLPIVPGNCRQNVRALVNVQVSVTIPFDPRSDPIGESGRRTALTNGSNVWTAETWLGTSVPRIANRHAMISSRTAMNAGTIWKTLARIAKAGVIKTERIGSSTAKIYGITAVIAPRKSGIIHATFTTMCSMTAGGELMVGAVVGSAITP
jgi:hypothetical protein